MGYSLKFFLLTFSKNCFNVYSKCNNCSHMNDKSETEGARMKKSKNIKLSLILCALLINGFMMTGCSGQTSKSAENESVYLNQQTSKPSFIMAGKVEAAERADVITKTSGKITELNVDVGSAVNKGDIIAKFDMKELPAQVSQAQATLEIANINLDNAELNYNRTQQLYQSDAVAQQELDTSRTKLNTANAQVAQAQAGLDAVNALLSNGVIVAPISGIVSAKNINEGETAIAGSTLISVVNPDFMYINAYLPPRLSGKVKNEQKVTVSISEIPDKLLDGEVTMIDPVVDSKNKNILVKVKLLEDDPALKVGMFAKIAIKK